MQDPERIGPFVIERRIGSGGMGTVYLGKHVESGQEVAVKLLPSSMAREAGFVARFEREINALKKLTNPHVVELYESGSHEETFYYAMEYVDGETLAVARWEDGQSHRLHLEPFEDNPQLETFTMSDTLEFDFDVPLYYAVKP